MGKYTFTWEHSANEVFVTGTFDDWRKTVKLEKEDGIFKKTVELPKTHTQYKFVMNGNWCINNSARKEDDGHGIINNVLLPEDIVDEEPVEIMSSAAPESTTAALAGVVPKESEKEAKTYLPRIYIPTKSVAHNTFNMRLIQFFDNGDYCLTSCPSDISPEPLDDKPFYGILSHRWGPAGDEITFQELMDGKRRSIRESDLARVGFRKLQFCQQRAAKEGLRYFWIDTCCINKQDQSELSYALNSMFHWYKQALRCYVYMSDVACTTGGEGVQNMTFENSQWFKRGWTLQELIAPTSVVFYSGEGTYIGSKRSLEKEIHQITEIPVKALRDSSSLSTFSAEERFKWTHGRKTTRPEDMAYCLLGIYDVWMTPIYADGDWETLRSRAIERLKSEIKDKRGKEEVVVIGGASWSDLSAISDHRLPELDQDIREYTAWLLQQGYSPTTSHLTQTSTNAGRKMRELLGKYDVDYNDDSGLHGRITTWQEPWSRFLHQKSSFERVRGFLDNRWWIGNGSEDCHTGIMAAKTLMGLILWRDIKDLKASV